MSYRFRAFGSLALFALFASGPLFAEPLSKSLAIDFYRDVPSRNLKGLATRSDGRLIAGPTFTDLNGPVLADLLWCLEKAPNGKWFVGTGPDGKIFELTLDPAKATFTSKEVANLEEPQIFALKALSDGSLLVGTSPHGVLALLRNGKVTASVALPVDSIFDFVLLDEHTVLAATGNPGRIYKIDLTKFSAGGITADRLTDEKLLAGKGFSVFGELHDRNVRRLALSSDFIFAGSSPKGNIYSIPRAGGTPLLLQENRDTEVAALLPEADGELFAALVLTNTQGENRINRPTPPKPPADAPAGEPTLQPAPPAERFGGRSVVIRFPKNGFPETIVSRNNLAFYALARRGDTLLISGGEQGDVLGYDLKSRVSLSFAGSASAQLNQLVALPAAGRNDPPSQFLLLRNNAPGLALLDFNASGTREAETRRLDLALPSQIGALRFNRIRNVDTHKLAVDLRTSLASDEAEGWSPWKPLPSRDDDWFAPDLRGKYIKARFKFAPTDSSAQLDKATLYYLPQNRRAQLTDFHLVSPNYAISPPSESNPSPITTLSQLIGSGSSDEKRKNGLLSSTVAPQSGAQIAFWSVSDLDGDNLAYTFSISPENTDTWTDLAVNIKESFVQFDIGHLPDGVYTTRLTAIEQAPRAAADRLTSTFETDDLVVDKTPPVITDTKVSRDADSLTVSVSGRDALSLLEGAEFVFNNGYREEVTQPADGIRDSKSETFVLRAPLQRIAGATSVEVLLYDEPGNSVAKRLELK